MDAQIKKGLIDICVLLAIEKGDTYGYELISQLSGVISLSESTLYPVLRRMENAGQVRAYQVAHNGRLRKYYGITNEGSRAIQLFMQEDFPALKTIMHYLESNKEEENL